MTEESNGIDTTKPSVSRVYDFLLGGKDNFAIDRQVDEDPVGLSAQLRDALPSGSFVAISHFHNPGDAHPEAAAHAADAERLFNENLGTGRWRSPEEILAYFGDLEVLDPGLVPTAAWRPEPDDYVFSGITYHTLVGGVARKA